MRIFILLVCSMLMLAACTKEVDFDPPAKNRMTEYKVTNLADTVIYGAIDNIENTITVYVPFYYGMAVIDPAITLEAGAKLSEEPEPVSVTDTTQTYTVKGSDGSSRTYQLRIVQNSTFPLNLIWAPTLGANPQVTPGAQFVMLGDFGGTSIAALSVSIISRMSGDTLVPDPNQPLSIQLTTASGFPQTYLLGAYLPVSIDSGYYDIHVSYLGQQHVMEQPLHVYYNVPGVAPVWDVITVKQGAELSFNASNLFINPVSVTTALNGVTYALTIQSTSTRKILVVKLPNDFPVGEWGTLPFVFRFGKWDPVTVNVPLTVIQ
jgi:hypothetical protein